MIVLVAVAAQLGTLMPPEIGFALDYDGTVLAPKLVDEKLRLARFRVDGTMLKETGLFEPKFQGPLEILPKGDGFVVADYETGMVYEFGKDSRVRWQTKVRYPTVVRMDPSGNVWAVFNSGYVMRKTPDSSEFEHILYSNGLEVTEDYMIDVVPFADGTFYSVQDDGEVRYFGADKKFVKLATIPTDRMIESKLGGVLCYKDGVIRHVSRSGSVRQLTTLSEEISRNVKFFTRGADGRLMVGKASGQGGTIIFLDPNIEK